MNSNRSGVRRTRVSSLAGENFDVVRARDARTGEPVLGFLDASGQKVAVIRATTVLNASRLLEVPTAAGRSMTLGPIDLMVVRRLVQPGAA